MPIGELLDLHEFTRTGERASGHEELRMKALDFFREQIPFRNPLEGARPGEPADRALQPEGIYIIVIRQENAEQPGAFIRNFHIHILLPKAQPEGETKPAT
jgi:hypothetical protein